MRILFFIIILTAANDVSFSQNLSRNEMRIFFHACTSKENTESFNSRLERINSDDAITTGYKGAVVALRAKYNPNPWKKYTYCRDGLMLLNSSIQKSPYDLELRYLRLIIESNTPSFLGFRTNIEEDKKSILKELSKEKDAYLRKIITDFLLSSDVCTTQEKQNLSLN